MATKWTAISVIETGSFGVNTVLLAFGEQAFLVDPGSEATRLRAYLKKKELKLKAILLTHAHFDHIGAVPELLAAYPGLKVYVDSKDAAIITHPMNQYPPDYPPIADPFPNCVAPALLASELPVSCKVIGTPGHTPGGVVYYFPDDELLLSGDTLFAGSFGRTDLPGGDFSTLMHSLAQLKALPPSTRVIPGHGRETTIADELSSNWAFNN